MKMNIAIISVYPPKGSTHARSSGVASYTKNLLTNMEKGSIAITVLGNAVGKKQEYSEDGIRVIRCWENKASYPFRVFMSVLRKRKDIDAVHVQHEYFLYGGALSAMLFPLMLLGLKILRKPAVVTMHGVISHKLIDKKFISQNNIKGHPYVLKPAFFVLNSMIYSLSKKIIVHENHFKDVLVGDGVPAEKIEVIPHGIEERNDLILKSRAKKILGIGGKKAILYFGYISGYKGIELLIDSFRYIDGGYVLFIAGGKNPRLKESDEYDEYLSSLKNSADMISENIIFTDFVPEEKIPLYFSAADLVVFPYRFGMSSSGPFSLAVAYGKPFIVSKILSRTYGIPGRLSFGYSAAELSRKIAEMSNGSRANLRNYVMSLKKSRNWKVVSNETLRVYEKLLEK